MADPQFNAARTIDLARSAAQRGAVLVAFPELGLSGYTCDDLFHQSALLETRERAVREIIAASAGLPLALVAGAPLKVGHKLFNCALVISGGKLCGVVPESYLPNYGEFYEARQFSAAENASQLDITLCGQQAPFAALLFGVPATPVLRFHAEICEDVWVPIPPSSFAALAGATVPVNLSASNIVIGKSGYRHQLVGQQSARCLSAYLYSSAGRGESTTDLAWDGQALIYENGELLAESGRFQDTAHIIYGDVDLERLSRERMRQTTVGQCARHHAGEVGRFRAVPVAVNVPDARQLPLERTVNRCPLCSVE